MPTTRVEYSDQELGLVPGWDEGLDPNIRKELRAARISRQERDAAVQEVEALRKERTLARAGIPSDKRGELFAKTYDGPVDDPAAVKAAYEELFGPLAVEDDGTGAAGEDITAGERRVAQATAGAAAGGTPGTVDLAEAIRAAKTTDEVKQIIRNAPPEAGIRLSDDEQ